MAREASIWRRLLDGWMAVAGRFGFVQTVMMLVLFYVLLIGPAWMFTSLARRDFLKKGGLRTPGSVWNDSESSGSDLERAKLLS